MNDPTNLRYEETPILDPVPEATHVFQDKPKEIQQSEPPKKPVRKGRIGTFLFVVILFGLGVWLSSEIRSFFAPSVSEEVAVPTSGLVPTSRPTLVPLVTPSGIQTNSVWQTHEIQSGVSYQLPGDVKTPVCDSARCASRGTNLPGGTRFTVAARGKGQILPDFRGAILTDAAGREFTMKQTMIGSMYVYEYTGDFTGRTGGGYTFTNIRGVLMPVSETLAVEFNHFAPVGITTDFEKDDELFDEIIKTFKASDSARPLTPERSDGEPATVK